MECAHQSATTIINIFLAEAVESHRIEAVPARSLAAHNAKYEEEYR